MSDPNLYESKWHGWSIGDSPAIHVGPLPGRKSIVLYQIDGSVLTPLAYFRDEDAAEKGLALLDDLMSRLAPYGVIEGRMNA